MDFKEKGGIGKYVAAYAQTGSEMSRHLARNQQEDRKGA
jgi:hypothetical protein